MNMRHYTDEEVARHYKITATRSLAAGDATAHLGWTLHRAPPNGGDTARKAYVTTPLRPLLAPLCLFRHGIQIEMISPCVIMVPSY